MHEKKQVNENAENRIRQHQLPKVSGSVSLRQQLMLNVTLLHKNSTNFNQRALTNLLDFVAKSWNDPKSPY